MKLKIALYAFLIAFVFSLALVVSVSADGDHPPMSDRDTCASCHTELLEPFESYPLPEIAKWKGRTVVVLGKSGEHCRLSGFGFTSFAPCGELQYPRNWFYDTQSG